MARFVDFPPLGKRILRVPLWEIHRLVGERRKAPHREQLPADPYYYATLTSHMELFDTQRRNCHHALTPSTRAMGRSLDVVRCQLNVT